MNAHLGGRGLKVRFFLFKQPWKLNIVLTFPSYTLLRAYRTNCDPFSPSTRSASAQQAASLRDDRTTHFDFDDPFSTHLNDFTTIFLHFATSHVYVLFSGSLVLFYEEKRFCIHPPQPRLPTRTIRKQTDKRKQTILSVDLGRVRRKKDAERRTSKVKQRRRGGMKAKISPLPDRRNGVERVSYDRGES